MKTQIKMLVILLLASVGLVWSVLAKTESESRIAAPEPLVFPAGKALTVPSGEVKAISVLAGGVWRPGQPVRAIYVFVSNDPDHLDCSTPNGRDNKGFNPSTVAMSMTQERTSLYYLAWPGQSVCWNVFPSNEAGGGASATIWSIPLPNQSAP